MGTLTSKFSVRPQLVARPTQNWALNPNFQIKLSVSLLTIHQVYNVWSRAYVSGLYARSEEIVEAMLVCTIFLLNRTRSGHGTVVTTTLRQRHLSEEHKGKEHLVTHD